MSYRTRVSSLFKPLRRFSSEESGMTLPIIAVSFFMMAGFVGTAVDIARIQLVQSKLSYSLDAAGLAAGATLNAADYNTEVTKYINVNYPAGYLGSSAADVGITLSDNNNTLNMTANTTVPTTFMNILGVSQVTVTASSQIKRTTSGLELALVLDNTGSMAGTKLNSLKTAANTLVGILFGGRSTTNNLWIGLVPFSQAVNIGTSHSSWMDSAYFSTLNWGPTSWMGCVDAHEVDDRDIADDPPSVATFRAYYSPSTDNRPYPNNNYSQLNANKWVTQRDTEGNPTQYSINGTSRGPNKSCPQQVQLMTADQSTITNAINSMQAVGNTHIPLGLSWGWRMISPRWRGLWGGEMDANALPLDYNTPHMNKAIVLLTDGANTMDNTNYTAYGYLSDGRLGTTYSSQAVNNLNSKLTSLCTSLKSNNVYIYTIALGNPGTSIQTLLRNCATSPLYYFNSPSESDLQTIFGAIADSLSNLRISQ